MHPKWRPILLLVAAGVAVHGVVLAVAHVRTGSIAGYAFRSLDTREYYRIACNIVDHGTFSQSDSPPLKPDTWRTPGYPVFLAMLMLVVGRSPAMLLLAQQGLGILQVLLLYDIARRFMTPRRATLAAVLLLVEPYHLFYSLWLMSETLFVTLLLLAWHAWQAALDTRRARWFGCLGLLAGALVLVRPAGILVPLAIGIGVIASVLRRRAWRPLVAYVLCAAAVPGAWMLRNLVTAGHFALSDQSGVVLAYFKATECILSREGRTGQRYMETSLDPAQADRPHRVWDAIDAELRERLGMPDNAALNWRNLAQGNRTDVDSFVISDALSRIAWSHLTDSPLSTAACCLARCGSILTFPLGLAMRPPAGVAANRPRSAVVGVAYLVLCLAALAGVLRQTGRRGRRPLRGGAVFFPLACTLALLLAATPQTDPRFRLPMIPLLVVLAMEGRASSHARR
jgi:hypothetical protein